jgi:hypothetical protein
LKRGRCEVAERKPLGFRDFAFSEAKTKRMRGDGGREKIPSRFSGRKPERRRSSREQRHHLVGNNQPGAGCAADLGSTNHWSADGKPPGFSEKRRSGMMRENRVMLRDRKKALKSETQECGKLKEASTDRGPYTVERVAKP